MVGRARDELRVVGPVDGVRQVPVRESAEQPRVGRRIFQLGGGVHYRVSRHRKIAAQIAFVLARVRRKKRVPAAKEHIDFAIEILRRDGLRIAARFHRDGESGGRGVRDFRGRHEPRAPSLVGEERVERREQLAIGQDVDPVRNGSHTVSAPPVP